MAPRTQKSGDSKRQDAEQQRQQDQRQAAPPTENLVKKVEDAHDQLKEQLAREKEERRLSEVAYQQRLDQSEQAIQRLTDVLQKLQEQSRLVVPDQAKTLAAPTPLLQCPTCRQLIFNERTKRGVCIGQHAVTRVLPKDSRFYKSFHGVEINGVNYIGRMHLPVGIVDNVLTIISRWEQMQLDKTMPKGRLFSEQDALRGLPAPQSLPMPNLVAEA